jgi:D-glycerate 3-kinase
MNIERFVNEHQLPLEFADSAKAHLVPLAAWIEKKISERSRACFVLGINGAQGTGKSTVSAFLSAHLESENERRVAVLSIDDLYYTKAQREKLAKDIHPLLAVRGVPGTHDVALGLGLLDQLGDLRAGQQLRLPRFDKANDERAPRSEWPLIQGPVDLVIVEGWCVGTHAQTDEQLAEPINDLEATQDANGDWRRYVNQQLATRYKALFGRLDALVFLQAPSLAAVLRWRQQQEQQLRAAGSASDANAIMNDKQVGEFVQHFERLSRAASAELPNFADVVLALHEDHHITLATYRQE